MNTKKSPPINTHDTAYVQELTDIIVRNISGVILGKSDEIRLIITALFCDTHVLIEDVPGTGKTRLARSLSHSIQADFKRIQFTIDLLPSDLTGIHFFDRKEDEFVFRPGPLFTNILLADEINRATARTQSSLLECMEEKQITVDGKRFLLSAPYFVIATQNPVETIGTFPLPEAQLDRFGLRISLGYPDKETSRQIMNVYSQSDPFETLQPVCNADDILVARKICSEVTIHPLITDYILDIIEATRHHSAVALGASPRAAITMMNIAKAFAATNGRNFVLPDDIKALAKPVLSHRLLLKTTGYASDSLSEGSVMSDNVIEQIINQVPCPTETFFS